MAAISHALFSFLQQGDHLLIADCVYAPVRGFAEKMLARMGVEYSYCPPTVEGFAQALQLNTNVIYIESPGSLFMQMIVVLRLVELAHSQHPLVVTDDICLSCYCV